MAENNYLSYADFMSQNKDWAKEQADKKAMELYRLGVERDQAMNELGQPYVQDSRDAARNGEAAPQLSSYSDYQHAQTAERARQKAKYDWRMAHQTRVLPDGSLESAHRNPLDAAFWQGTDIDDRVGADSADDKSFAAQQSDLMGRAGVAADEQRAVLARDKAAADEMQRKQDEARIRDNGRDINQGHSPEGYLQHNYGSYKGQDAQGFLDDRNKHHGDWKEWGRTNLMGALQPHTTLWGGYNGVYGKTGGQVGYGGFGSSDAAGQDQAEQDRIYRKYAPQMDRYRALYGNDVSKWKNSNTAWSTLQDYYKDTHNGQKADWDW